ncbi:MAG: type I methionyl aminopeptidase [Spirochaetales bacterium]|uniref:Methionine aminopeptidase n=1 Tax=Candidatus Thalassospirochaeta sargassi TaxID=3119039 RepID=A0AAJ1MN17_9SPIO|nr:type I methionyl aminopeptidase [Spirochaetales bacterium]
MIRLKNDEEIKRIRESCKMLAEVYQDLIPSVEEGISTLEVNRICHDLITKRGGTPAFLDYSGYPASICISINDEVIHGIPSDRVIKDGDLVSLDLGIDLKGYFSDSAITVPVGNISPDAKKLIEVTKQALSAGIDACVHGNRIKDISASVFKVADKHNYGVVREFCGHGVGFEVHESPQIPNYVHPGPNPRIKKGMVLAIEPMINLGTEKVNILDDDWTVVTADGKISAHFEHTLAVFEDHTEILTIPG